MTQTILLTLAWLLRPVVAGLGAVLLHWLLTRLGAPPAILWVYWALLVAVGFQVLVYEGLDADESDARPLPKLPPP